MKRLTGNSMIQAKFPGRLTGASFILGAAIMTAAFILNGTASYASKVNANGGIRHRNIVASQL